MTVPVVCLLLTIIIVVLWRWDSADKKNARLAAQNDALRKANQEKLSEPLTYEQFTKLAHSSPLPSPGVKEGASQAEAVIDPIQPIWGRMGEWALYKQKEGASQAEAAKDEAVQAPAVKNEDLQVKVAIPQAGNSLASKPEAVKELGVWQDKDGKVWNLYYDTVTKVLKAEGPIVAAKFFAIVHRQWGYYASGDVSQQALAEAHARAIGRGHVTFQPLASLVTAGPVETSLGEYEGHALSYCDGMIIARKDSFTRKTSVKVDIMKQDECGVIPNRVMQYGLGQAQKRGLCAKPEPLGLLPVPASPGAVIDPVAGFTMPVTVDWVIQEMESPKSNQDQTKNFEFLGYTQEQTIVLWYDRISDRLYSGDVKTKKTTFVKTKVSNTISYLASSDAKSQPLWAALADAYERLVRRGLIEAGMGTVGSIIYLGSWQGQKGKWNLLYEPETHWFYVFRLRQRYQDRIGGIGNSASLKISDIKKMLQEDLEGKPTIVKEEESKALGNAYSRLRAQHSELFRSHAHPGEEPATQFCSLSKEGPEVLLRKQKELLEAMYRDSTSAFAQGSTSVQNDETKICRVALGEWTHNSLIYELYYYPSSKNIGIKLKGDGYNGQVTNLSNLQRLPEKYRNSTSAFAQGMWEAYQRAIKAGYVQKPIGVQNADNADQAASASSDVVDLGSWTTEGIKYLLRYHKSPKKLEACRVGCITGGTIEVADLYKHFNTYATSELSVNRALWKAAIRAVLRGVIDPNKYVCSVELGRCKGWKVNFINPGSGPVIELIDTYDKESGYHLICFDLLPKCGRECCNQHCLECAQIWGKQRAIALGLATETSSSAVTEKHESPSQPEGHNSIIRKAAEIGKPDAHKPAVHLGPFLHGYSHCHAYYDATKQRIMVDYPLGTSAARSMVEVAAFTEQDKSVNPVYPWAYEEAVRRGLYKPPQGPAHAPTVYLGKFESHDVHYDFEGGQSMIRSMFFGVRHSLCCDHIERVLLDDNLRQYLMRPYLLGYQEAVKRGLRDPDVYLGDMNGFKVYFGTLMTGANNQTKHLCIRVEREGNPKAKTWAVLEHIEDKLSEPDPSIDEVQKHCAILWGRDRVYRLNFQAKPSDPRPSIMDNLSETTRKVAAVSALSAVGLSGVARTLAEGEQQAVKATEEKRAANPIDALIAIEDKKAMDAINKACGKHDLGVHQIGRSTYHLSLQDGMIQVENKSHNPYIWRVSVRHIQGNQAYFSLTSDKDDFVAGIDRSLQVAYERALEKKLIIRLESQVDATLPSPT